MRGTRSNRRSEAVAPAEENGTAAALFAPRRLTRDGGPLYRQLAEILRQPISDGTLATGTSLPREADIAQRFGVSLITVRQALRDLENDGLIRKRPAKPAVVATPDLREGSSFGFQSFAEIAASTRDRRIQIHSYRREHSSVANKAFGLPDADVCHCLRATLFRQDVPSGLTTFYFPPAIGARLKRSDFDDVVVFRSVQRHLGIKLSGAKIRVSADVADDELARALDYEVGGPILVIEMLYSAADGTPVELTINKNRADLFSLTYDAPNDLI